MRGGQPGDLRAHSEPETAAWYSESPRKLTARLNFVLGEGDPMGASAGRACQVPELRLPQPDLDAGSRQRRRPSRVRAQGLVALRDARPRPDEEKNDVRPVPEWAIRQQVGTTHVAVDELGERTREAKLRQEELLRLVEQGHRRRSND